MKHIGVTIHAKLRWQERVSGRAVGADVLIAALKKSKRIKADDYLPFAREPGMAYFFSEEHKVYFLCDVRGKDSYRIVTVHDGVNP